MTTSLSPEAIRGLRGGLSRAAFATQLGVTPHTIYRWELPADAKDARRPRGAELERLLRLRSGGPKVELSPPALGLPVVLPGEELGDALGAIARVMGHDWQAGRAELLRIVTQRTASPDARALGASGLAIVDALLRSDPRSALATLSPALSEADEDRLSPHAAAWVYATAACAHALANVTLFDAGRVHAYAGRAETLAHGAIPEVSFLAWLGTVHVAVLSADDELLGRAVARLDAAPWTELPPLLAAHELEARSLRAMFAGQRALAVKLNEEGAEMARTHGYALVEARAVAVSAMRKLDELAAPDDVLAIARRAQHVASISRAAAGAHTLFALRAEIEALLRAGRTAEALATMAQLDVYTAETGLPPLVAVSTIMRAYYLTGRYDALVELARSLRACDVPSLRGVCRANASLVEALHLLATSDDPEETILAVERAARDARGWNFLLRDVLVFGCTAYILVPREAESRVALRRAQRLLDRVPSPWASAHLRRVEGALAAAHGRWSQGRQLLESAIGTFETAGDVSAAALARHLMLAFAYAYDEPGAQERLEASRSDLAALGLAVPTALRAGVDRIVDERRADAPRAPRGEGVERLVAPLQRLTVRGAEPALLQRELVTIAADLVETRPVRLEELDSAGAARTLGGSEDGDSSAFEWFEFGDGGGRRLRLGALAPIDAATRALLAVVATAGGLAIEIATLRNAGVARPEGVRDEDAEIPGLIAASPPMRALRAEIMHVATSRSTVVIEGESGSGKEVVARAIHDLSTRARLPYIAFNCATVPRELFDGQLFGYRRGAFTGAARDHAGMIRAAEGGTLFLDEIGELPLDVQPKLLRFLENGEVFPLGDKRPIVVDVRVIAATHRDLAALVRERRFREDLYYRLQVIVLRVAPLRERREDIAPIARHFLRKLAPGATPAVLAPDALAALTAYDWPGNVRELRNVIERVLAYSPTPRVLHAAHLKLAAS